MSMDIQQQKQYKVLLIGEICQDVYVFGDVNRLSPEAPVPVLKKTKKEYKKGMAGNVFKNIQEIVDNAEVHFYCNEIQKIKKIRYIDEKSKYQIMRYDIEKELNPFNVKDVTNQTYDLVVISDYNKGFLSDKVVKQLCELFKNTPVFVDTKRKDLSCYTDCVIKINESEAADSKHRNASTKLIITMGSRGCMYQETIYPVKNVDVHDVCGAGDVFLAALAIRWLETNDMVKSIKTANQCASLSITKLGCYTLNREEYENLCI